MKLLVILLCIMSERYLVHAAAQYRCHWFDTYFTNVTRLLSQSAFLTNPFIVTAIVILPVLLATWGVLFLLGNMLYGFIALLINVLIFYFCLGPENPFYPLSQSSGDLEKEKGVRDYFSGVNNQLFAVIFWFIFTGLLGVLLYRLLYLCKDRELTKPASVMLVGYFDWICARVTLLLYLLVGNFQQGFRYYTQMFFSSPENNDEILGTGGLLAARSGEELSVTLPYAQTLVEHALVVYLVFMAFFTLVAWL